MSVQTSTYKRTSFLSLLIVGDVIVTWCTRLMMIGQNFCWWIVTFACTSQREEGSGCISFGNQELMENILNCARYWQNFLISSENITNEHINFLLYFGCCEKDDLQGYSNFRKCIKTEEKLTFALRYVFVITVRIKINYVCKMLSFYILKCYIP